MSRRRLALVLLCVPLLLASPGADAQGGGTAAGIIDERVRADGAACRDGLEPDSGTMCTVLYAHIFHPRNAFLNTQRPPDNVSSTMVAPSVMPGLEAVWDFNQVLMRPTAVRIDYDSPHSAPHEIGIAGNITLDADRSLFAYWYLAPDATHVAEQDPEPDVGALPCLTVRMQVFTERFPDAGAQITEGQATKTLVSSGASAGSTTPELSPPCAEADEAPVRMDEVADFEIGLPAIHEAISGTFSVQVEWWNHAPGDPDEADKVYLEHWKVHSGPDQRPRLVLPVQNSIEVLDVEATVGAEEVNIRGLLNTPWGYYDVVRESVEVVVLDSADDEVTRLEPFEIGPANRYDAAYRPVILNATWNVTETDPPPGRYTLRITATDLQGTREAMGEASVSIQARVEEAPPMSLPSAALLMLVAVGGVLWRRAS